MPEYTLADPRVTGGSGGQPWKVMVQVKNVGKGRMPVEVAAVHGDRFTDKGKPKAGYRDARITVTLGAGEAKTVAIACAFKPDKIVVDPDVQVLQLRRKAAVVKF